MKRRRFVLLIVAAITLFVCFRNVQAQQTAGTESAEKERAAQQAAESWLAYADADEYAESWDGAAETFKAAIDKEKWEIALRSARAPLGKLVSRKLKTANYTTSLPGAADGEYVVLQYESSFENKKSAVETITPAFDKDGKWRVSGYYIK